MQVLDVDGLDSEEARRDHALEWLSRQDIIVTYEQKKGILHANTRDINVTGVSVNFHGKPLLEDTQVVINYGNRYGLIGPNGSGKSVLMKALSAVSDDDDDIFCHSVFELCVL